jgi:hypothetical protein
MDFDSSIQAVPWFYEDLSWKINYFDDARGLEYCQADREIYCVSWKNSSVVLDMISTLWPNTKYAGENQHPGRPHARLRADALSLVLLLTPAYPLIQSIFDLALYLRHEHSSVLRLSSPGSFGWKYES